MKMRRVGVAFGLVVLLLTAGQTTAETIKIVAFGTSNTYGRNVPRGQDYPAKLEAALKAKGHDVHVINAGRNGDTIAGGFARMDAAIPPDTKIVIVEFGANDRRAGVPPATIQAGLDRIVDKLRGRNIEVLVANYMDVSGGGVARGTYFVLYDISRFPPEYKIADDPFHHLNAAGYDILVARMVPPIGSLIARVKEREHEK